MLTGVLGLGSKVDMVGMVAAAADRATEDELVTKVAVLGIVDRVLKRLLEREHIAKLLEEFLLFLRHDAVAHIGGPLLIRRPLVPGRARRPSNVLGVIVVLLVDYRRRHHDADRLRNRQDDLID